MRTDRLRPRIKSELADKGYDAEVYRELYLKIGTAPRITGAASREVTLGSLEDGIQSAVASKPGEGALEMLIASGKP
jgi:hypothetical protein